MSDRKRGMLTSSQREYLSSGAEFSNYTKRNRIRDHVHASLLDAKLLFEDLPEEDREKIFDPHQAPHVDYDSPLDGGENRGQAGNRADIEIESYRLEAAVSDLIAFMYEGLIKHRTTHSRDFSAILQNAMHKVERRNDWMLEEYEFTAEFYQSDNTLDEIHRRFKDGQATMEEATRLLQAERITAEEHQEYAHNYSLE
jgi:hypothetical protein